MKLLTQVQRRRLLLNSQRQGVCLTAPGCDGESIDFTPVVKLFCPWGAATWLLTELDEDGRFYGLCDLGFGTPELGYVSIGEMSALRGPGGLKIERDRHFNATEPLSWYAAEARREQRITA